jgi:hypothetical protein
MQNHSPLVRSESSATPVGPRAEAGLALVEVMISLLVVAVATLGGVSWTMAGVNLDVENRETRAANDVMRRVVEELSAVPFEEVYARFNDDPADDPGGVGTAVGGEFVVMPDRKDDLLHTTGDVLGGLGGLLGGITGGSDNADSSDAAGHKGARPKPLHVRVKFPTNAQGKLSESGVTSGWSTVPLDLDGNGRSDDDGDLGSSYRILPIRVEITWQGARGERSVRVTRLMGRRQLQSEDE